jgi:predicted DCC family thiol-disulfide oxidoreductase YuxK
VSVTAESESNPANGPVLLYDGVCGLCNRAVRFVLRRDRRRMFRFAALQSAFAAALLARHQRDPEELSTVVVVLRPGASDEQLLTRSDAALFIAHQLGGFWKLFAGFGRVLPRAFRDAVYNLVARWRYRLFGKYDVCPLPRPEDRARFIDA